MGASSDNFRLGNGAKLTTHHLLSLLNKDACRGYEPCRHGRMKRQGRMLVWKSLLFPRECQTHPCFPLESARRVLAFP
eukprot:1139173-Pelagomonas_calceolata.AAC.4